MVLQQMAKNFFSSTESETNKFGLQFKGRVSQEMFSYNIKKWGRKKENYFLSLILSWTTVESRYSEKFNCKFKKIYFQIELIAHLKVFSRFSFKP